MKSVYLGERSSRWWDSRGPTGKLVRRDVLFMVERAANQCETDITIYLHDGSIAAVINYLEFSEPPTKPEAEPLPSVYDVSAWKEIYGRHTDYTGKSLKVG